MSDPIPLSTPDGVVRGYLCGVCLYPPPGGVTVTRDGVVRRDGDRLARYVADSLRAATGCCTCGSCGDPLPLSGGWRLCAECHRWAQFCELWEQVGSCASRGITTSEAWWEHRLSDGEDE